MNFLQDELNMRNGLIYMVLGVACSFTYYMINFYVKYLPGSIFTNQIVNSLAESFANGLSFLVVSCMSVKKGFLASFVACITACILVIFAEI